MSRRGLRFAALAILCGSIGAATASAAGPDPGVAQDTNGLVRGKVWYVATAAHGQTVLKAVEKSTGRVVRKLTLRGNLGVPRVAFDGTLGGVSADEHTLVLGQARTVLARKTSSFAVVDLPRLKLRSMVKLRGDFSFDALSPSGGMLYLIEHISAENVAQYRVRAYDLAAGRLLRKMVTDKRRWQSVMEGIPVTRATSKDSRWAFTLYGASAHPFVHSLDTQKAYAVCIDLPQSWQRLDVMKLRLRMQGEGRLAVRYGAKQVAMLDTKNFRVLSVVRNP